MIVHDKQEEQRNGEHEQVEEVLLGDSLLEIPRDLFENEDIFNQFFSIETWNDHLPEDLKLKLFNHLPEFPENDDEEKLKTIEMLFDKEVFHFSNPLLKFRDQLMRREFSADNVQMNRLVREAKKRNFNQWLDNYQFEIAQKCLNSRKKHLEAATGNIVTVPKIERKRGARGGNMSVKIKRRIREEMMRIRQEVGEEGVSSDEDNDDDCRPVISEPRRVVVEPFTLDENDSKTGEEKPADDETPLTQDMQPCFLSLLSDLFHQSPDLSLSHAQLEAGVRSWETSPIAPLNTWFSLAADGWISLLHSAVSLLSGHLTHITHHHFSPLISLRPGSDDYQWTDSADLDLLHLNDLWLEKIDQCQPLVTTTPPVSQLNGHGTDPAPGNVTSWQVRPSTEQERLFYQEQEVRRYAAPAHAWQWQCQDYTAVVAPIRNIAPGVRPHPMLLQERPASVTLLSLVRDAVSRLPRGEGTRSDILELLRDSQYLVPDTDLVNMTNSVSGALDRLQNDADAPVKYDSNRKIWIYMHRAKTLEELNNMDNNAKHQRQRQKRKFKIDSDPTNAATELNQPVVNDSNMVEKVIVKDADGNIIPLSSEMLQKLIDSGALKQETLNM